MDFIDFMLWKLLVLTILAFFYGIYLGAIAQKEREQNERPKPATHELSTEDYLKILYQQAPEQPPLDQPSNQK